MTVYIIQIALFQTLVRQIILYIAQHLSRHTGIDEHREIYSVFGWVCFCCPVALNLNDHVNFPYCQGGIVIIEPFPRQLAHKANYVSENAPVMT